jgi:uncharacterized membrane protein HdeD (DUF308 family)
MQSELRMHRLVLAVLVILLAAFLAVLLYLSPRLANQRMEAIVSLAIVVVAAAVFVAMGLVEGTIAFQFGMKHKRELLTYLLLGMVSIVSGLYLAVSKTASLQTIALTVAPHALLFGIGELRVSQHLQRHPLQSRTIFFSGLCEVALGIALIYGWTMPSEDVARLLGYTAILSVLQLLPLLLYKRPRARLQEVRGA